MCFAISINPISPVRQNKQYTPFLIGLVSESLYQIIPQLSDAYLSSAEAGVS